MDDAVARYRTASEANDIDALISSLAVDAELVSPLSGRMVFRGRDDLRTLLAAIYGTLGSLRWSEEIGNGSQRVMIGEARVGWVRLSDAMVFDVGPEGLITRIRPHLRPWLALSFLAVKLLPKMVRHPAMIVRALRHS